MDHINEVKSPENSCVCNGCTDATDWCHQRAQVLRLILYFLFSLSVVLSTQVREKVPSTILKCCGVLKNNVTSQPHLLLESSPTRNSHLPAEWKLVRRQEIRWGTHMFRHLADYHIDFCEHVSIIQKLRLLHMHWMSDVWESVPLQTLPGI